MKKVLVFGTFDRLHKGHVDFLRQARRHGDSLVAVVTRDANVKKMKGKFPDQRETVRANSLRKYVGKVYMGEVRVTYKMIKQIDPDVICIGYDQKPSMNEAKKILKRIGMEKVVVKKMRAYRPSVYKSHKLR